MKIGAVEFVDHEVFLRCPGFHFWIRIDDVGVNLFSGDKLERVIPTKEITAPLRLEIPNLKYPNARTLSAKGLMNLLHPTKNGFFRLANRSMNSDATFSLSIYNYFSGFTEFLLQGNEMCIFAPRDAILLKNWFYDLSHPKSGNWHAMVDESLFAKYVAEAPLHLFTWGQGHRYLKRWRHFNGIDRIFRSRTEHHETWGGENK